MKVLAILRAEQFSPNSVEKDTAIMTAITERLQAFGYEVTTINESRLQPDYQIACQLILSMGRLPATLRWLEAQNVKVINTPQSVARCKRSLLEQAMKSCEVPVPPTEGSNGYWLKRGDSAAQTKGDVVYCADKEELKREVDKFHQCGIDDYTVSTHVVGDVVKFYGVRGTGFFRHYYPTDDGISKFGDEQLNGLARHHQFKVADLQQASERLAAAVGIDVYGGDCIVKPDGMFCLIDFNDWPSFSRCREEAAEAIVKLIIE